MDLGLCLAKGPRPLRDFLRSPNGSQNRGCPHDPITHDRLGAVPAIEAAPKRPIIGIRGSPFAFGRPLLFVETSEEVPKHRRIRADFSGHRCTCSADGSRAPEGIIPFRRVVLPGHMGWGLRLSPRPRSGTFRFYARWYLNFTGPIRRGRAAGPCAVLCYKLLGSDRSVIRPGPVPILTPAALPHPFADCCSEPSCQVRG